MVGIRNSAGLLSKVNALMIDMYDEGGKLSEYSTQIIQTSKNITLLATRVTNNESSIATLTVNYDSITSTVSSLSTTVNGHTESISQINQTVSGITTTVSSLSTTVNGHTESISQLQQTDSSISARVTTIENDYVTSAELSLYVDKNSVTWLTGSANNVVFNFTTNFQIQANSTAVLSLDTSGNLYITGTLNENSKIGSLVVDSSGNLKGSGSLVTDGLVAGYKTQTITISSTNNSVQTIEAANGLFVFLIGSVTSNTHYFRLPTLTELKSALNITSSSIYFSARLIVVNQSNADYVYLTYRDGTNATTAQPWKMSFDNTHYTGGSAVTQLAKGDYIEILLMYHPGASEYRAFEVVHQN